MKMNLVVMTIVTLAVPLVADGRTLAAVQRDDLRLNIGDGTIQAAVRASADQADFKPRFRVIL